MKKTIIDTNALISFVTDRNPTQQKRIADVLEGAARLQWIVLCPQNVLTEFVYVLDKVYDVAFSPDGRTIASGSADRTLRLWKGDGALLKTFNLHTNAVTSVAFSPDERT